MENIQPGDRVRDIVSGLVGIVVSRTRFLTGCDRVAIQLPVNKDGEIPKEFVHADINAVDLVETQVVKIHKDEPKIAIPAGPSAG